MKFVIVFCVFLVAHATAQLPGGLGIVHTADPFITNLVSGLRAEIERLQHAGVPYPDFKVISYRDQVVNGHNYFIKIDCGDGSYLHVRIYRDLLGNTKFIHVDKGFHTKTDPILYFP